MGAEDKIETGQESRFGAYCNVTGCEWERYSETNDLAHILFFLHMIVKHPDAYYQSTKNNPYEMRRRYAELIRQLRRHL